MTTTLSDARVAVLENEVKHLRDDMIETRADVRKLLELVQEARGGWKGLALAMSLAGAAGAFVTWIIKYLPAMRL